MVIGLNIHTAPVEMREKLAIPEAEWPRAITELCNLNHIEEAAVLSTCNRMEIYVLALSQHRGVKEVTEWMSKVSFFPHIMFSPSLDDANLISPGQKPDETLVFGPQIFENIIKKLLKSLLNRV